LKIMQYIELEDKNGQRIYQGDIVRYGYLALNDVQRYGEEPWKHLPDGIREDWITTVLDAFVIEPNLASIDKVHQLAYDNPDVIGVEIMGNVFQQPFLLQQYGLA
jgi:YopX protein